MLIELFVYLFQIGADQNIDIKYYFWGILQRSAVTTGNK